MKTKIKVDIFSDVVCPWCYIGKRRFEKAIKDLENEYEFEVQYLPFELNPGMPKAGVDQQIHLANKFGGYDKYLKISSHVTQVAAGEGLKFNFDLQKKSPNTKDAHRLIWLASKSGVQLKIVELLFKAYFEEGMDLTDAEILIQLAVKAGMNAEIVSKFIASTEGEAEVDSYLNTARKLGITGVPFYIINNQYGISGAQPSDVFENVIREAVVQDAVASDSCDVNDKNC